MNLGIGLTISKQFNSITDQSQVIQHEVAVQLYVQLMLAITLEHSREET